MVRWFIGSLRASDVLCLKVHGRVERGKLDSVVRRRKQVCRRTSYPYKRAVDMGRSCLTFYNFRVFTQFTR